MRQCDRRAHRVGAAGLEELRRRGEANDVPGLERIGPERLAELEPHVRGVAGLFSPRTGIVDFGLVAATYADEIRERGGELRQSHGVRQVSRSDGMLVLETDAGEIHTPSAGDLGRSAIGPARDDDQCCGRQIVADRSRRHRASG